MKKSLSKERIKAVIFKAVEDYYANFHKPNMMTSPKKYINYGGRVYDAEEMKELVNSALDFWLTSGTYAKRFEEGLAKFLGMKYCLITNSGSSANLLAVSALTSPRLGRKRLLTGDEVITTACGFPTTANPIIQNGLVPVFVDVDLETYNIDAGRIERAITNKTKAIFIAHTLGNPADMDKIVKAARRHGLFLLEDNCDSLGSRYRSKYTGTFGDISTCSFYPPHHITMGEGGAVLTNNPLLRRILLSLRDWGRDCWCESGYDNTCGRRFSQKHGKLPYGYDHKYVYSHIGYNLRATDMQAAVGCAQLKKLAKFIAARKKNFKYLQSALNRYGKYFLLPKKAGNSEPSWFGFPILVRKEAPFKRKQIVGYLEGNNIATRMLFGGNLTKQPAYLKAKYRIAGTLKNTDLVMNNLFWIGVYPGIGRDSLDYIVSKFAAFFKTIEKKK